MLEKLRRQIQNQGERLQAMESANDYDHAEACRGTRAVIIASLGEDNIDSVGVFARELNIDRAKAERWMQISDERFHDFLREMHGEEGYQELIKRMEKYDIEEHEFLIAFRARGRESHRSPALFDHPFQPPE